jgi:hypothetical protein
MQAVRELSERQTSPNEDRLVEPVYCEIQWAA